MKQSDFSWTSITFSIYLISKSSTTSIQMPSFPKIGDYSFVPITWNYVGLLHTVTHTHSAHLLISYSLSNLRHTFSIWCLHSTYGRPFPTTPAVSTANTVQFSSSSSSPTSRLMIFLTFARQLYDECLGESSENTHQFASLRYPPASIRVRFIVEHRQIGSSSAAPVLHEYDVVRFDIIGSLMRCAGSESNRCHSTSCFWTNLVAQKC